MVTKPTVIEIIRNEDEFLKEEVISVKKEIFNLKEQTKNEVEKINSTDSLRYNKINYDVFSTIKMLNEHIYKLKNSYKNKTILDEKNRRKVDTKLKTLKESIETDYTSKIHELNEELITEIQNKHSLLTETCDLMKVTSNDQLENLSTKTTLRLSEIEKNIEDTQKELYNDYVQGISKLNEELSTKIIETNEDIANTETVIVEYIDKLNDKISKTNKLYEKEQYKISELLTETANALNSFKDEHNEFAQSTLNYITTIQESHKNYKEEVANNLARKLNSTSFNKYVKDLKEKFKEQQLSIDDLKENLLHITTNIIDKISLTNESALNSEQINSLIIQLLETKFDQKLTTALNETKTKTKTNVEKLNEDIKSVNDKIEKFIKESIVKTEYQINKKIEDVTSKLEELDKKESLTIEDVKKFIEDNPDLFKIEGRIPDHLYKDGWLFFEKPDGSWGTPIKVKNDQPLQLPIMGGSGLGGGAVGGSLEKYYLTKLYDVIGNGFNEEGKLLTWNETNGSFVFNYRINDDGISTSDLWTADKIIDYTGEVAGNYIPLTEKGQPEGVATLDENGKVPSSQLTIEALEYKGLWDASANDPNIADSSGNTGDFYIVSVAGTQDLGSGDIVFELKDWVMYNGTIWQRIKNQDLDGYVPYTGATGDVDLGENDIIAASAILTVDQGVYWTTGLARYGLTFDGDKFIFDNDIDNTGFSTTTDNVNTQFIDFDLTATPDDAIGRVKWNAEDETLDVGLSDHTVGQMFMEDFYNVSNETGSDILDGTPVMFSGVSHGNSGKFLIVPAIADGSLPALYTMGIATQTILNGETGKVTSRGNVRGIKTDYSGTGVWGTTWAIGNILYVSETNAGVLTNVAPQAPNFQIPIASVMTVHATNGTIWVRPSWHCKVTDLDDVNGTPLSENGQLMVWDNDRQVFDFNYNIDDYTTREDWAQNGFENRTDSLISLTGTVFSIAPAVDNYSYYIDGVKYTIADTKTFDLLTIVDPLPYGLYIIYMDNAEAVNIESFSTSDFSDIVLYESIVGYIYWDATNTKGMLMEERHGKDMSPITHAYLHLTRGTAYESGLGIGVTLATAKVSIDSGVIWDEDIKHTTSAVPTSGTFRVMYRQASPDDWTWEDISGYCFKKGTTYIQYDNSGVLTEVANTKYCLYHIFASNIVDITDPTKVIPISIMGQSQYDTIKLAREGANTEIASLVGIPISEELKPIATIIFRANTNGGVGAVIVQTEELEDYVDWRANPLSTGTPASDHGLLSGLGDDDHSQYTLCPASSTDNAIAKFDGTDGRTIQNSNVIIDDDGNIVTEKKIILQSTTEDNVINFGVLDGEHRWTLGQDLDDNGVECFKLDVWDGLWDDYYVMKFLKSDSSAWFGGDLNTLGKITADEEIEGLKIYEEYAHNYEGIGKFFEVWRRLATINTATEYSGSKYGLFELRWGGDRVEVGGPSADDYVRQNGVIVFEVTANEATPSGMQLTVLHASSVTNQDDDDLNTLVQKLRLVVKDIGQNQVAYIDMLTGLCDENNFWLYKHNSRGWILEETPFPYLQTYDYRIYDNTIYESGALPATTNYRLTDIIIVRTAGTPDVFSLYSNNSGVWTDTGNALSTSDTVLVQTDGEVYSIVINVVGSGSDTIDYTLVSFIDAGFSAYEVSTKTAFTIKGYDSLFSIDRNGNISTTGTITGSNLSGTNTGDQDLSDLVPYSGADQDLSMGDNEISSNTTGTFGSLVINENEYVYDDYYTSWIKGDLLVGDPTIENPTLKYITMIGYVEGTDDYINYTNYAGFYPDNTNGGIIYSYTSDFDNSFYMNTDNGNIKLTAYKDSLIGEVAFNGIQSIKATKTVASGILTYNDLEWGYYKNVAGVETITRNLFTGVCTYTDNLVLETGATIDNSVDGVLTITETATNFVGTVETDGLILGQDETLSMNSQTLKHDGTEFVMSDDLNLGDNDIQATEFRMGANAVMKFNSVSNSIDFIIN